MRSLDAQFTSARREWRDALSDGRETERLLGAYSTALENPYREDAHTSRSRVERAHDAFGPLLRAAIEAGHHGRWIHRRLPDGFQLTKTDNHEYATRHFGGCGVAADIYNASSGISDRQQYVEWPN